MNITKNLVVRTYDIDFAGIVSNIVYLRWLEDLRIDLLEDYYSIKEQLDDGISPILLETQIHYDRAIVYSDSPVASMKITGVKGLRWTLEAEISVNDAVCTRATQRGIFINIETRKPIRVPERIAEAVDQAGAHP